MPHAAEPVASDPTGRHNGDIGKPKKAGKPIDSPKIVAVIVKKRPFQKTWMMHLQQVVLICKPGSRVGKSRRIFIRIFGIVAIFVAGSVKSCPNFPGENTEIVFLMKIFNKSGEDDMKRRFTGNELFRLRNLIPVDVLIGEKLNIPSKIREGYFRFLCPVCREFQTATNPKTNLARCFLCEKNFNPIDLVMIVKDLGFVESVGYLESLLPDLPAGPRGSRSEAICETQNRRS